MQLPDSYPETLRDLAVCIQQTLNQITADPVVVPALAIVEGIRARFGGSLLYVPKGTKLDRATRDARICAEFTGRNHRELARRYGITVATVYDIIAAHRKAKGG